MPDAFAGRAIRSDDRAQTLSISERAQADVRADMDAGVGGPDRGFFLQAAAVGFGSFASRAPESEPSPPSIPCPRETIEARPRPQLRHRASHSDVLQPSPLDTRKRARALSKRARGERGLAERRSRNRGAAIRRRRAKLLSFFFAPHIDDGIRRRRRRGTDLLRRRRPLGRLSFGKIRLLCAFMGE